jgi:hypothetical protein
MRARLLEASTPIVDRGFVTNSFRRVSILTAQLVDEILPTPLYDLLRHQLTRRSVPHLEIPSP